MAVLPVCLNNQQHDRTLGLDMSRADRVPTLFSRFIDVVQIHKAAFVFEDQRRQFE